MSNTFHPNVCIKMLRFAIPIFVLLLSITQIVNAAPTLVYLGRDDTTQGNWTGAGYGECGYALPFTDIPYKEVATGKMTGIGDYTHERWWIEPWGVEGKRFYPYEDYRGGLYIPKYEVLGPKGPPRPLVNASNDYYRPTWYCHDDSITINITNIDPGYYNLSLYFLDWDAPTLWRHRKLEVNVTSSGSQGSAKLGVPRDHDNFAAGIYAVFEVEVTDGSIIIEVNSLWVWTDAVISGIFLNEITGPVSGVNFIGVDRSTMGNWRTTYGNDYYLLAGFNAPNGTTLPMDEKYDVTNLSPSDYSVSAGTCQFAADDARTYGVYPFIGQYSALTWYRPNATDDRVLIFPEDKLFNGYPPTLNGRNYTQWDSGEMNGILNYFIIKSKIPDNAKEFSVYAMDWARANRSETIEIWDESMSVLLDSQHISGDEINNGIYLSWSIDDIDTINIKVIADEGNLNCILEGIFFNNCPPIKVPTTSSHGTIILISLLVFLSLLVISKKGVIRFANKN